MPYKKGDIIKFEQSNFSGELTGYKKGIVVRIEPYILGKYQHCFYQVTNVFDSKMKEKKSNLIGEVHDFFSNCISPPILLGVSPSVWTPTETRAFWEIKIPTEKSETVKILTQDVEQLSFKF